MILKRGLPFPAFNSQYILLNTCPFDVSDEESPAIASWVPWNFQNKH